MGRPRNDLMKCLELMEKNENGKAYLTEADLKMRFPVIYEEAKAIHERIRRLEREEAREPLHSGAGEKPIPESRW